MLIPFLQKYKPVHLDDFYFDNNFVIAIKNLLAVDILNILFIGNSGTGKTSIISALIHEYYAMEHISKIELVTIQKNILYINNLKDQGISYYRNEVKTFCQTQCTIPKKKKVLIIDDLDMINIQSQQVFRNCIDSYGNNIHFIASCSNTQKVINSIQSRTTIIRLKHLRNDALLKIINIITTKENIPISENAKQHLLHISDYSTAGIINYLEKCKLLQCKITKNTINAISTNISYFIFDDYTNLCVKKKYVDAVHHLYGLFDKGYSVLDILDCYFHYIKQNNSLTEGKKYRIIIYISKYISIFHNEHEDEIELALFTNNVIDILSGKM